MFYILLLIHPFFLGIDLFLTCGEGVDFLFLQFGWKDSTIEGGLYSSMDSFLCG